MISATIIADSISPAGIRLTTAEVTYPTWLLPQLNTHRMLSRSSGSSRAIPIHKLIERVESDPAIPIYWGKNQAGMKAAAEIHSDDKAMAERVWLAAMRDAVRHARTLSDLNLHKQTANRLLAPFSHTSTIITATDWQHFFNLRRNPDSQPEMRDLADHIYIARSCSKPVRLRAGEWHLPYIDASEMEARLLYWDKVKKISVSRCARVSYNNHNGTRDIDKDLALHDKLLESGHMSPFEHVATPIADDEKWMGGNLIGWQQYRKFFSQEYTPG